jgi:integrase/recombinase XerD
LSPEEVKRVLTMATSLKARAMLTLAYGCGLRASEVVRLRACDIDSEQMIIRIVQSKGRKDRNVMLPAEILDLLRHWWKARPTRRDAGGAVCFRPGFAPLFGSIPPQGMTPFCRTA